MHIKRRGTRALLYRSFWVPKGAAGNTHGYSTQTFVGSLSLDAETLPPDFASKFSEAEVSYLENKLFQPARLAAEQKRRAVEYRATDPMWRLDEAARLSLEAAVCSERAVVPNTKVAAIHAALAKVRTITPVQSGPKTVVTPALQIAESGRSDPLRDALIAIKAARDAVMAGRYGTAPAEGVRNTHPYKLWTDIFEAIEGSAGNSLMRALQAKGFVKTREVRR
ncbi:hypothetical protein [Rhodoferax ferrireducens]|uniref:hypothetical protein n=1 Tax=Rhodoferax ferrireducens TaxID=192843 RepID=UPI000E0DA7AE|nr:hypothetical protein [Rhodoferax ferrireducens]